jgi:uncharacterized membrane protein YeaQ/YmgE (transglycosylase-associated protein family)
MLHLLWSIIIGFVTGLVARALLPGADHIGFILTTIVGVLGSVVGGFIGNAIRKPAPGATVHAPGFIMSVVGAILLLVLLRLVG